MWKGAMRLVLQSGTIKRHYIMYTYICINKQRVMSTQVWMQQQGKAVNGMYGVVGGSSSVCFLDANRLWSELQVQFDVTAKQPTKDVFSARPHLQPLRPHASSVARPSPCWCCSTRLSSHITFILTRPLYVSRPSSIFECSWRPTSPLDTRSAHLLFPPHHQTVLLGTKVSNPGYWTNTACTICHSPTPHLPISTSLRTAHLLAF